MIHDLQWWQYDVLATLRRRGEPYRMAATDAIVCLDPSQTAQLSYLLRLVLLAQESLQGG